ncbi:MAG: hypothetical protein EA406_04405 [Rhodospirillales bacterium]|nr:MAG: hypothetical protein EA406_04405 [Rhodospirillales bacterium]
MLVSDDERLRAEVEAALGDPESTGALVVAAAPRYETTQPPAGDGFDVILLDAGDNVQEALPSLISALGPVVPGPPVIVLSRSDNADRAAAALRAGAQEHLVIGGEVATRLPWAIRCAVERQQYIRTLTAALQHEHHESELRGLRAMCGPAPLAVSARSFGSTPLSVKVPELFEDMVRTYEALLDSALEEKALKGKHVPEALNQLADQLGALDASPRDIVELHKAAINSKIGGQTPSKARAYVEEGRLVMVRLMGQLATFYRTLSWGSNLARGASGRGQPMTGALPGKRTR